MASPSTDELLAAIRRLPLDERRQLIERAVQNANDDTPEPTPIGTALAPSLLALMADESELVDRVCSLAYEARNAARPRAIDE